MSLFGALYSAVSGLGAESNQLGIISDNIANSGTIGYKRSNSQFQTLVTNSGIVSAYSPGGVLSHTEQLTDQQGLIQGTSSGTDVAISGNGFFVINTATDGSGNVLYTRAGSFTQDNLGNFINSAGFFLQGWPLDRNGDLPGAPGNSNTNSSNNLTSLKTVNVQQATGAAAATTAVTISANLQGSQAIFPGASVTAALDRNTVNFGQPGKDILIPGGSDSMQRGDKFTVSTGAGLNYTYRYGGFTYSRSVTGAGNGDSGQNTQARQLVMPNNAFTVPANSTVVHVASPANGLISGDVVTFSGVSGIVGGAPNTYDLAALNTSFVVSNVTANGFDITLPTASTNAAPGTSGGASALAQTRPFAGNILDASTETQAFLATTGTSSFLPSALGFTITTQATGTVTFQYTSSTPNAQLHQFNNLDNLANAINAVSGLSAQISSGRLYVGATDANAAISFANVQTAGNAGPPVQSGIDWVRELGLSNIGIGDDRFNSLDSLATIIKASAGLSATVSNDLTSASLAINVNDPLDTVSFTDLPIPGATTYPSATPFNTTVGSNVVTVSSPSPNGFKTGDLVSLDDTAFGALNTPISLGTGSTIKTGALAGSHTITFGAAAGPANLVNGDIVHIDPTTLSTYPNGVINGIPVTDLSGAFVVSNVDTVGHTFDITVATASAGATQTFTLGASDAVTVSHTFNGIPIQDFSGKFPIVVTGPSTFTIDLPIAASASGGTGLAGLKVTPPNNSGSILAALGLVASLNGTSYTTPATLGPIGPEYDPTNSGKNMAGGGIQPQYSQNLQVYDSLGTGHNVKVSFIKTAVNTWAVELYAVDPTQVSSTFADGLLAYGSLTFNGDGSLRSVSSGISSGINVPWTDGALQSTISFNWGTAGVPAGTPNATQIGGVDGMTQFDTAYKINSIAQNGAAVGELTNVSIDSQGYVIANFNNGQSQKLYKIPLATFSDPDQMTASSGNAFQQSAASGEPNLRESGLNGAGKLQSSALESSTVDISTELTNIIIAQRNYQANAKVIEESNTMLDDLNNIIR